MVEYPETLEEFLKVVASEALLELDLLKPLVELQPSEQSSEDAELARSVLSEFAGENGLWT
jgi:hypothetical protein